MRSVWRVEPRFGGNPANPTTWWLRSDTNRGLLREERSSVIERSSNDRLRMTKFETSFDFAISLIPLSGKYAWRSLDVDGNTSSARNWGCFLLPLEPG